MKRWWIVVVLLLGCARTLPRPSVQAVTHTRSERLQIWVTDASSGRTLAKVATGNLAQDEDPMHPGTRTLMLQLGSAQGVQPVHRSLMALALHERAVRPTAQLTLTRVENKTELRTLFTQSMWRRVHELDRWQGLAPRPIPADVQQQLSSLVQVQQQAVFNEQRVAVLEAQLPEQGAVRVEVRWLRDREQ